ncbi:MAG TPA: efflux RND transporter periplasmic adaptor subunit [Gammaproteobacteria bacterium]|nr:efflux RND transporter periplasmic adaptor subunit [Gammaproteobacteria bacterium]
MIRHTTFITFLVMLFTTLAVLGQQNEVTNIAVDNITTVVDTKIGAVEAPLPSIRILITPRIETVLSSQIAGRIIKINVDLGSSFRKGQILLEFDCKVRAALFSKAKAELKSENSKHKANLRLNELQSISNLDLAVSEANQDRAKALLAVEWARLKMCKIIAPFNGRLIKRKVQPYESVSQGQPLLEILDDSLLELEMYVPSSWLNRIRKGIEFSIKIDETGKEYSARITSLGASVDPVSHTIGAKAVIIGKHNDLLSGMSGEASFKIE